MVQCVSSFFFFFLLSFPLFLLCILFLLFPLLGPCMVYRIAKKFEYTIFLNGRLPQRGI